MSLCLYRLILLPSVNLLTYIYVMYLSLGDFQLRKLQKPLFGLLQLPALRRARTFVLPVINSAHFTSTISNGEDPGLRDHGVIFDVELQFTNFPIEGDVLRSDEGTRIRISLRWPIIGFVYSRLPTEIMKIFLVSSASGDLIQTRSRERHSPFNFLPKIKEK